MKRNIERTKKVFQYLRLKVLESLQTKAEAMKKASTNYVTFKAITFF